MAAALPAGAPVPARPPAPVEIERGAGAVVLAFPHSGLWLPPEIRDRLNDTGRILADTDWSLPRLFAGLLRGATSVQAPAHRYLVDPNRDPAGTDPGLAPCPLADHDGAPIWRPGAEPDAAEAAARIAAWHAPYHAGLAAELARVRARHGVAILVDCHSVRSVVPHLFDGTLHDLNIGTNDGLSCDPTMEASVLHLCRAADGYSYTLNGRFKGGYTIRRHGRPDEHVHALQIELAQSTYLAREAPPWPWDAERAEDLREQLGLILETLAELAPTLAAAAD